MITIDDKITYTELFRFFDLSAVSQLGSSPCSYFDEVITFAKSKNLWDCPDTSTDNPLRPCLVRLARINVFTFEKTGQLVRLYKDFAPYSFTFSAGDFYGGLVYHGSHDGGGDGSSPTFSVNLNPVNGWSIHT